MPSFAETVINQKYAQSLPNGEKETWPEVGHRVASNVLSVVPNVNGQVPHTAQTIASKKFIPGGRYLANSGARFNQVNNCLLLRAEDSREGWGEIMQKMTTASMTGAGLGIDYSALREKGAPVKGMRGTSSGPLALMYMVNEAGRYIKQGGHRRVALWAGLKWNHPDVFDFIALKDWDEETKERKNRDFSAYAPMDLTNISVQLDDDFFEAYHKGDSWAHDVYWAVVQHMLETGEPGFSIDTGSKRNETLRNACTEITSEDDSDVCNLGSLNMAAIETRDQWQEAIAVGTELLLAGTLYSSVPYPKVAEVREKNRRLGLGLMGIHEWLLKRGKTYDPDEELAEWLGDYQRISDEVAHGLADQWGISRPVATRAVAPTGTLAIVGETTSSIEPVFCKAMKRRYYGSDDKWHYQYIVDATVSRLIERGVDPDTIEDAYELSHDVERRVGFQKFVQGFVDQGVSSTINLPQWGSETNNPDTVKPFGDMLINYLPHLRGITSYPDGSRGGQPLSVADLSVALANEGVDYEEAGNEASCNSGSCGI